MLIKAGVFIGSISIVVEGVRVGAEGNVLLTSSTNIIDVTGDIEKIYNG